MILVICAPSGAGKTTLIRKLLIEDKRLQFSISTTTRTMRPSETDGVDYYFVSHDRFQSMVENDEFIEWAEVHGNYYGSSKKEIDRIVCDGKIPVFDIDIQGSKLLRDKLSDTVYVFISPPSFNVLKERLVGRMSDSRDQVELRLKNARKEMLEYRHFDYVVVNDDIDSAFNRLKSIIEAEACKTGRYENKIREILEDFDDYSIG